MVEWRITEKLAANPNLMKSFDRTLSHPLIRKYSNIDPIGHPRLQNLSFYKFNMGLN